ncbi:BMP family ABC transporter substrate-binding protein [Labrys sp. KB_33_2]|uniref:BMP family ABC transporter substrate-binding protein n=1 Tax=unclassified Labrys (in: a-proteobacteria) TaxID=2688601 RepID=UPI003EBB3A9C
MKKTILAALAVCGLMAGAGVTSASAEEKLKVGFIYVGPVGDFGWSYQHDVGRKALVKALGDKVETTYVESVQEGPDAQRAIENLADSGHKLIFTTSFGFMDPTIKAAKNFPDVKFEHATGFKRAENVSTYAGRFYEGRYVEGVIAAKMSKSGIVGYVAPFPIPEVISGINSFMRGAQSVRPDMKIKIVWTSSWYDPGKEADASKALIAQGADILATHTDSPAATQAAAEKGINSFGQDSDMIAFGPKTQLTAIINHWDDYYIERAKAVLDGTWKSEDTWEGLDKGMVKMAPYTNMPDDVKKLAEETEAGLKSGKIHPFTCPVANQTGETVECKGGDKLDASQILGMNWYVKGIDDKFPN